MHKIKKWKCFRFGPIEIWTHPLLTMTYSLSLSLSFREEDLDRGGFGVFSSDSPGYYVEQEVLGGQYFPLLEEDSGRNTGLRRRDRTPTHSKSADIQTLKWHAVILISRWPTHFMLHLRKKWIHIWNHFQWHFFKTSVYFHFKTSCSFCRD